jgi:LRR receptor-like serine/threonine-protein kinase FLS2
LVEDGEVLLEIKKKITADPNNVTYWWKRQGKSQALNPCKMLNAKEDYWPGLDCTDFGRERRVTSINLSNMSLAGTLSPLLGKLSQLQHLDLSNNLFTGSIPAELPAALETLDLSNNRLELEVQASLGDLQNLTSLNVSNNLLTGIIPASFGSLQLLSTLNMSGNNLTGEIPTELNSCLMLSVVDLSGNGGLNGLIPFQGLESLTTLHLQNNQFMGNFVVPLNTFPLLLDLDLSNNGLSGFMPATMSNSLVQRIDLSGNKFAGSLPDAVGNLSSLRELDVSGSGLSGALPGTLASLSSLTTFKASHNNLNGSLPSLAGIQSLRVFDASFNNLSGSIPTDFVDFPTLVYLNVSYNNLSGEVPSFVEHDQVNGNSFLQNIALCGPNVAKVCTASSNSFSTTKIVSISVGGSVALAVIAIIMCICCRRHYRDKAKSSATVSAELDLKLTPEEVRRATQNFSDRNYVGVGSMSTSYRGVLPDATVVAVKRLGIQPGEINEAGEKVLDDGFAALAQVRDWTLVKVVGYCCSQDVKALVMEYMPNGTLGNLMYPPRDVEVVREFNWSHRFNAAISVAQGLKYLHHESRTSTVHGDLKPSNVLFSTFMEARIADFGVKRLLASHGFAVGASLTSGYTAPELAASPQGATIKGDVYSFGIIVLEMVSGRSPQSLGAGQRLPQWIRATISNSKSLHNVLDPILMSELRVQQQRMAMVLGVALLCTRDDPQERPYITEVLKMLNHIKTRPQDGSRRGSARRLRSSLSEHQRNEEIRQEMPAIEITPSPRATSSFTPSLPTNPSLSHWTPNSAENR